MMSTLSFSIDRSLFSRFPALKVGGFVAADLDRAAALLRRTDLDEAWRATAATLAQSGITRDNVTDVVAIRQWRQAFEACGVEPARYAGRVESLVVSVLAKGGVTTRVPIAELCSALSARYLAPLIGHDVDALPQSTLDLRQARPGSDWFVPLGARPSELPLHSRIVVYTAGETVLSWSFNHRESRQTCLASQTKRAVFFSEAVMPSHAPVAERALRELCRTLAERGARVTPPAFVDINEPGVSLQFTPDEDDHE